jgi:hypothetical protein
MQFDDCFQPYIEIVITRLSHRYQGPTAIHHQISFALLNNFNMAFLEEESDERVG